MLSTSFIINAGPSTRTSSTSRDLGPKTQHDAVPLDHRSSAVRQEQGSPANGKSDRPTLQTKKSLQLLLTLTPSMTVELGT